MTTDAPVWFRNALADAPEHRDTMLDGCRIHLRCWGDGGSPGLVLVHGGSAHSGWWDHVGPLLARSHRVVALDLSGHGDSGWRRFYDLTLWAREILRQRRRPTKVYPAREEILGRFTTTPPQAVLLPYVAQWGLVSRSVA